MKKGEEELQNILSNEKMPNFFAC